MVRNEMAVHVNTQFWGRAGIFVVHIKGVHTDGTTFRGAKHRRHCCKQQCLVG